MNFFQGEVEIIEGEPSSDSIRIDVDKSGPTVPSLDYIVAHYALYDVGEGMVYVVQVVSRDFLILKELCKT